MGSLLVPPGPRDLAPALAGDRGGYRGPLGCAGSLDCRRLWRTLWGPVWSWPGDRRCRAYEPRTLNYGRPGDQPNITLHRILIPHTPLIDKRQKQGEI